MVQVGTPEVVVMTIGINPEVGRTLSALSAVLEVTRASVYRYLSETEGNES